MESSSGLGAYKMTVDIRRVTAESSTGVDGYARAQTVSVATEMSIAQAGEVWAQTEMILCRCSRVSCQAYAPGTYRFVGKCRQGGSISAPATANGMVISTGENGAAVERTADRTKTGAVCGL